MVYDLRNLQTNYTPGLGPNIPFLVLYAKNEVAAIIVRVYMPIFVGNPREDSHIKVKGLLVGKLIIYYLNPQGRPMWVWLKLKLTPKGDFCEVSVTAFFSFFCKFLYAQP